MELSNIFSLLKLYELVESKRYTRVRSNKYDIKIKIKNISANPFYGNKLIVDTDLKSYPIEIQLVGENINDLVKCKICAIPYVEYSFNDYMPYRKTIYDTKIKTNIISLSDNEFQGTSKNIKFYNKKHFNNLSDISLPKVYQKLKSIDVNSSYLINKYNMSHISNLNFEEYGMILSCKYYFINKDIVKKSYDIGLTNVLYIHNDIEKYKRGNFAKETTFNKYNFSSIGVNK